MIIHTWRNIFFFEGLFTILVGLAAPFVMPRSPEDCWFLNERERKIATRRLVLRGGADENEKTEVHHVKRAMMNITNYFCAMGFFFINITVQGISLFMVSLRVCRVRKLLTVPLANDSFRPWLEIYKGTAVLCASVRVCLCDCDWSRLSVRQDQPPWHLSRHLYHPCYCWLLHYALGH